MTHDTHTALDVVTRWLIQRKPELTEIPPDLDLIRNRVLDSLALAEFLFVLQAATGQNIDPELLTVDDFRTLKSIEKKFLAP